MSDFSDYRNFPETNFVAFALWEESLASWQNRAPRGKNLSLIGSWNMKIARLFGQLVFGVATVFPAVAYSQSLAAGGYHTIGIRSDGTNVGWGLNSYGQSAGVGGFGSVVAVAGGREFSLGLRSNGTVVAAGSNSGGQVSGAATVTNATAISAGREFALALRSNGTVAAWGYNGNGQVSGAGSITNATAVAAGHYHSLALRADGTVAAWGWNGYGQVSGAGSASNAVAIAAGYAHSFALRSNGTIVGWGDNYYGQISVASSLSNVVSISSGEQHGLAIRSNGTVAAWGYNGNGETNINGLSNAVYAVAGGYHSYAVMRNGSIVSYGRGSEGQRLTPTGFTLPTTVRWNAAVSGDYLTSHRWDGRIPSTALSTAEFTQNGTYNISFGNTAEAHGLNVTAGNVTFDLGTNQYLVKAVTISNGATFNQNGTLTSSIVVDNFGNYQVFAGKTMTTPALNNSGTFVNNGTTNGGVIVNAAAKTITNNGTLNGSTLNNSGTLNGSGNVALTSTLTNSGSVTVGSGKTFSTTGTGNSGSIINNGTFNGGAITNSVGGTFTNTGTLNGTTFNNNGTLVVATGSTATLTSISGAGSVVNNGTLNAAIALDAGGSLSGSGTISGALTVADGAVLAPGNSVGLMSGSDSTWASGGVFEFEINDASGTMGGVNGWDGLQLTGTLDITATNANPFLINLSSLTLANNSGLAVNFDATQNYAWTFATAAGGITGFDAGKFQLDSSGIQNNLLGGSFSVTQSGNSLVMNFTAVPEPSAMLLVGSCLGLITIRGRRRL